MLDDGDEKVFLGELKVLSNAEASKELLVGFFADATYPAEDNKPKVYVAAVAHMQEVGTDRIPARPFFRPAITEYEDEWAEFIEKHLAARDSVETILTTLGGEIVGRIQEKISQVFDPPLAPLTLAKRRAKGNKSTKPLVDTGRMRQAVAFHIKDTE